MAIKSNKPSDKSATDARKIDIQFMQRALSLATETVGLASPNPQVGCVLVRDGAIIAEGAHLYDNFDHAEIVALMQAGALARGATVYVTLEPCSHHGRTGPCADALIDAGVHRVVIATADPNPQVSGDGINRLRSVGIEVILGICQLEARDLNDAFAHWIQTGRPLVTLKAAISADGSIGPPPSQQTAGKVHWITGPEAREEVQLMRHQADAVLTGVGTVLADNPKLTDRSGLPRRRKLLRVILDSRLRAPLDSYLVEYASDDVLILCDTQAEAEAVAAIEAAGVEVVRVPGERGQLDLAAVLDLLGRRQILNLLLEAGSHLNAAFLAADLVDKAVLFSSRKNLGPDAIPFATRGPTPTQLAESMLARARSPIGPDTRLAGVLRDPWRGLPK
jgi:diaminohydroxyphosphoribosylaminopyrimidine deaminase/5-amino-6-(5-phosphoribosylamino)uracil reductase